MKDHARPAHGRLREEPAMQQIARAMRISVSSNAGSPVLGRKNILQSSNSLTVFDWGEDDADSGKVSNTWRYTTHRQGLRLYTSIAKSTRVEGHRTVYKSLMPTLALACWYTVKVASLCGLAHCEVHLDMIGYLESKKCAFGCVQFVVCLRSRRTSFLSCGWHRMVTMNMHQRVLPVRRIAGAGPRLCSRDKYQFSIQDVAALVKKPVQCRNAVTSCQRTDIDSRHVNRHQLREGVGRASRRLRS